MKWQGKRKRKEEKKNRKNTNVVLVFCPVLPLRLMFLCDILWTGCCLRGGRSCCRLRWAAVGGRSCVAGSRLLLLSLFWEVCARLRPQPSPVEEKKKKKRDASRLTSFILLRWKSHTPLSTFKLRGEKNSEADIRQWRSSMSPKESDAPVLTCRLVQLIHIWVF